ncbi:MAG: tRNA pseudouridine(38-40) synthase TruA [Nocardioidaceae bacterium]
MTEAAPRQGSGVAHLRFDVSYDGSHFSGWASQPGQRTVQGTLEAALGTILRLSPNDPSLRLTVAGRTDAGVHARGQVCSLDVDLGDMDVTQLRRRLGRLLSDDVVVRRVSVPPPDFDARFSAQWRRYAYRICDGATALDPLRRHEVLTWPRPLDAGAMNDAALSLLGEHDFAAFCKRREGATTFRDLMELSWSRREGELTCRVVANAFCHTMVRSLVGCLLVVGEGRRAVDWPAQILAARVRDSGVLVVPAHGLTLEEVGYRAT